MHAALDSLTLVDDVWYSIFVSAHKILLLTM